MASRRPALARARRARVGVAGLLCVLGLLCAATPGFASPSIAEYDTPKYPDNFTHFDYADADAPDTGSLNFENYNELTSYDSLNPFLVVGNPAPDIQNLMFDTLMQRSWDELASEYALIADDVEVAPDRMSATFRIDPRARFNNGDPITAADVKYSFDTLKSPQASPLFNSEFSVIRDAKVIDRLTVRFDFMTNERDGPLIAGDLPVFSPKWGMRPDGTRPSFDKIATSAPIASSPYLIESRKDNKTITYVRDPHYWAANLPSRRGMFRFRRITFKLYADLYTSLEAFKAGDVDARMEYSSNMWARQYIGKNFRNGMLAKATFPDGPAQMQGFWINTRRPKFQDPRVREALALAFDYDWMNRMLLWGQYRRTNSYFDASPFAATGLPDADELKLLEPFRSQLPPAVFGPMIRQPTTLPPHSLRANLREARDLFAQAGWHYRDGALRDAQGTPFTVEVIDDEPGMDRLILPYLQALNTLGVQTGFRELDSALYMKRLDNFDFDLTTQIYPPVTIPGSELLQRFGSKAANEIGSMNYSGVHSKVVDALVDDVLKANTIGELETATHALDRVLINLYLVVPQYYLPNARIGYKTTLGHPQVIPTTYQYEDWIIDYWFVKHPDAQAPGLT
ncbi:extracellular solute-binding protein [Burkholderia sp. WAC0059]|uniref:extracellular solute-binding protein n=1 Tax=Burkholderia sp. WAC0059 TaxID=2066022 RepID=UPI002155C42C|nr:extracellular solute-binding protein [Burkholderia sp. WAC0059]